MATAIVSDTEDRTIPIFIMGKKYDVPETLTIMKAMEHAGYQYIRGCGCRGGVCGACATVYRKAGDYKIYTGLACQTEVEPDMYLAQISFYPANRAAYDFEALEPTAESVYQLYPELFRCAACNACTNVCPMDVEVLDYVSAMKRGDIEAAAEISFDCIQCGLCASRCMGEMAQDSVPGPTTFALSPPNAGFWLAGQGLCKSRWAWHHSIAFDQVPKRYQTAASCR